MNLLCNNSRRLYWCDWGTVAKIEKASMDGTERTILHTSGLIWPNGITIDYSTQVLYWIDGNYDRIESSYTDGSNRTVIASVYIYRPFSITLFRDMLYFTDRQTGINAVPKTGGTVQVIYNNLCDITLGIEVIAEDRQPTGSYNSVC